MFHVKHSRTPYILCRAGKPPQAARKARKAARRTRRAHAEPAFAVRRNPLSPSTAAALSVDAEMRAPPRGSFGKAETPVRTFAAKRQTGVANAPRIRRSARRIISIYNNEENRAKFARKPRENLPLPPAFPRRFSAVKHARETYGRRADFRVVGTGKCRRLCRKLPAKTAFSARESKKIFARKKVCFRTAYI